MSINRSHPSSILRHTITKTPENRFFVDANPNGSVPSGTLIHIARVDDQFSYSLAQGSEPRGEILGVWVDAERKSSRGELIREKDDDIQSDEVTHIRHLPGNLLQNYRVGQRQVTTVVQSINLEDWNLVERVEHVFPF